MADWEGMKARMAAAGNGHVMRFQTRATPDGNVAGWNNATWDESSGTFRLEQQNGETRTRQTIVPSQTSRDSNGEGRTYNIGSGIVDIETTTTKTSSDQSARVSVKKDNLADTTADLEIDYPAWGPDGRKLRYIIDLDALPTREAYEAREEPSALDGISLDVDSVLMEEGYTATETTVDDETGEETETVVLDTSNEFVAAIRSVTDAVVTFLGSLFGLNNAP
jgi:hypothetical protein